jgi:hypothetical protein
MSSHHGDVWLERSHDLSFRLHRLADASGEKKNLDRPASTDAADHTKSRRHDDRVAQSQEFRLCIAELPRELAAASLTPRIKRYVWPKLHPVRGGSFCRAKCGLLTLRMFVTG